MSKNRGLRFTPEQELKWNIQKLPVPMINSSKIQPFCGLGDAHVISHFVAKYCLHHGWFLVAWPKDGPKLPVAV